MFLYRRLNKGNYFSSKSCPDYFSQKLVNYLGAQIIPLIKSFILRNINGNVDDRSFNKHAIIPHWQVITESHEGHGDQLGKL